MIAPLLVPLAPTLAATSTNKSGSSFGILIIIVPVALLFLFMSRANKKKQRAAHALQTELTLGATVVTIGGLHATVVAIADDTLDLEIAPGIVSTYARRAVAQVLPPATSLEHLVDGTDVADQADEPPAQEPDDH